MSNEYYTRGDSIQPHTLADARAVSAEFTKIEQAFDRLPNPELLDATSDSGLFGHYTSTFAEAIAKYSVGQVFICDQTSQMLIYTRIEAAPGYTLLPAQPFALQNLLSLSGGSGMIGAKNGGKIEDLIHFVTPEQKGAGGLGITDDTAAIQAALDTGLPVLLAGSYLSTGSVQSVDGQVIRLDGRIIKKPGTVNTLLEIAGNDVIMDGMGWMQDFNRTASAAVTAGTSNITLTALSGGSITYYANGDGRPCGTPIWGDGIVPGTRIIGGPATGGSGSYTLDRPQPANWSGSIRFMDAASFWWGNRTLLISGQRFEGNPRVFGSAGDGITIEGRNSRLRHPLTFGVHDNGIIATGDTAGGFVFDHPVAIGSGWQNGIFIVAGSQDGSQSVGGPEYVHGGLIHNPTSIYIGDTALELGWHAKDIKVTGHARLDSYNPPILLRDCLTPSIESATAFAYSNHGPTWSVIAVAPSVEASDWKIGAEIRNVKYDGKPERAFAYIQQSGVRISGCIGNSGQNLPANYALDGFAIGTNVTDIDINEGNKLYGYINAVNTNWGGAPSNPVTNLRIRDNDWISCTRALNGGNTAFTTSYSIDNEISSSENIAPYNLTGATFGPSGAPAKVNLTVADKFVPSGMSGSSTPTPMFNPVTAQLSGVATDLQTRASALSENQTDLAILCDFQNVAGRMLKVWLSDGSESAVFFVNGVTSVTSKLAGTSGLLDQSGFAGSAVWSLGESFGQLVLRRCGVNTGQSGRHVMWSIV